MYIDETRNCHATWNQRVQAESELENLIFPWMQAICLLSCDMPVILKRKGIGGTRPLGISTT